MTTQPAPGPRFVTLADLEALEGRLINRLAELELRMERRFNEQTRWIVGLILPIYALVLAIILTVAIAAINILGRLP
jgi:hypothetical protein